MIGLNPAKLRQRRIAGSAQWTVVKPQPAQRALRRFAIRVLVLLFVVTCTATARSVETVRATIEKETAWTGEVVPLVVTLYSPGPFSGTASFGLPKMPRTAILKVGNPVVGSEVVDAETWFTQRHEFKLYTQQSGSVVVPPFPVHFNGKKTFTADPEPMEGTTSELRFQSNRPPGTEKLGTVIATADMDLAQTWLPNEMDTVQAGDVIQRTITRRAAGTTAMMIPPAPSEAPDGVRVYTSPPTVEDKTDRGQSNATRRDILKYQFERPGTFDLPELRFAWWDTESGELKRELLSGNTVTVTGVVRSPESIDRAATGADDSRGPLVLWIAGIGLLAWVVCKPATRLVTKWQTHRSSPIAVAARKVEAACHTNDASAAYSALLEWQRGIVGDGKAAAADLRKHAMSGTEFQQASEELSSHLFGNSSGTGGWSGGRLSIAFSKAGHRLDTAQRNTSSQPGLRPLNP